MSHPLRKHDGTDNIIEIPGVGKVLCYGTVPADGAQGYAPGCLFYNSSGSSVSTYLYVNKGTLASSQFGAITLNA